MRSLREIQERLECLRESVWDYHDELERETHGIVLFINQDRVYNILWF